jgi:hypothetical protein
MLTHKFRKQELEQMNSRGLRRRNGAAIPQRRHDQIIAQIVEQKDRRTLSPDEAHTRFVTTFFSSAGSNEEQEGSTIEQSGAFMVSLIDPVCSAFKATRFCFPFVKKICISK